MAEDWRFRRLRLHFIYWVCILACVIIFLITKKFGGDTNFVQYISFAAGLAGLLLAVVAIIYSFLTTEASSRSLSELRDASETIAETSSLLKMTAEELEKKFP